MFPFNGRNGHKRDQEREGDLTDAFYCARPLSNGQLAESSKEIERRVALEIFKPRAVRHSAK